MPSVEVGSRIPIMPIDAIFTKLRTDRRALFLADLRRQKGVRLSVCALAVGLCATSLAGCDVRHNSTLASNAKASVATSPKLTKPVPVPDRALLSPQPEPDCNYNGADPKVDDRMKLDYERQCYRHAEMIVRGRLELLQSSVDETIKAVKRTPRNGS